MLARMRKPGPCRPRRPDRPLAGLFSTILLCCGSTAAAESFVTLSGEVYLDARVERAEPDGLVVRHRTGEAKLLFTDLPEPVRRAHGFDPQRAADHARTQQARAEEDARLRRTVEERHREAPTRHPGQPASPAAGAGASGNAPTFSANFSLEAGASGARAAAGVVGEQMARRQALEDKKNDPSLWGDRVWRWVPVPLVGALDREPENPFFTPNHAKRANASLYGDLESRFKVSAKDDPFSNRPARASR